MKAWRQRSSGEVLGFQFLGRVGFRVQGLGFRVRGIESLATEVF